jgi:hypothetical protein
MKITELLASGLNRRDEEPNEALALEIIRTNRTDWVRELINHLNDKDKNIQSDCIKVLYEIGERGSPGLIAPYCKEFGVLLQSKNNRLVWGAMTALDTITPVNPEGVYELLPVIVQVIDKGSVITIDHGVGILSGLASFSAFSDTAFPLLMEQLKQCPIKQLPLYAEKSLIAIDTKKSYAFISLIESRLSETEKDSQKSRLLKVIRKIKNSKYQNKPMP